MAYELRENSGSLFKNEKKTTDSHPNATGTALIGGVKYRISAWTKEGKKGKFQSLSFQPMDDEAPTTSKPKTSTPKFDDMD